MARRPSHLAKQIESIQSYLRIARANYNRAYRELSAFLGKRRTCPFELHLRGRRCDDASRLLRLAELCLGELRHLRALSLAPFRPGDQIRVSVTMKGYERAPQRYLVRDVEWRKGDMYGFVVHEITKGGWLHHGRYWMTIYPSNRISIEACTDPLDEQTVRIADGAREEIKLRRTDSLEREKLELFDEELKRSRW